MQIFRSLFLGKIERLALASVNLETIVQESLYDPPRTPVEETLVTIWGEVLNLPRIGIHNNFFDLGGHSLLAVEVMFRTRECFGIELPLRALFDAPTIVEFAQVIESGRTECFAINNISEFLEGVETLSEYEARQELGPSDDE